MNAPADRLSEAESWTCPSCGASVSSRYCPGCGERRLGKHDLTLRHLFEQLLESLIHFDGRLFRTTRVLVTEPGRLTVAYLTGCRRPYVSPFHIFLVANVIFFFAQVFSGFEVLTIQLDQQLNHQEYSSLAQSLATHHLAGTDKSIEKYAPGYNHAEALYSKSLIMLMLPLFAVAAGLLFVDKRKVVVTHLVFAIHFYAFLLVCLTVVFPTLGVMAITLRHLGLRLDAVAADWIFMPVEVLLCVFYLAKSAAVVYGVGTVRSGLSAGLLTIATLYILYGYRFILFLVTLWTT
jgi:hypothetical protein